MIRDLQDIPLADLKVSRLNVRKASRRCELERTYPSAISIAVTVSATATAQIVADCANGLPNARFTATSAVSAGRTVKYSVRRSFVIGALPTAAGCRRW